MSEEVKRKIYFRLDAGGIIGYGHLFRCLSIADNLKSEFEIFFVIRKRASIEKLEISYPILWLPQTSDAIKSSVSTWINESEEQETQDFLTVVHEKGLLFCDHYGLGSQWHRNLKKKGFLIVGFKDYRNADVDFDLEISYGSSLESHEKKNQISGLNYIPLNPKIANYSLSNSSKNTLFSDIGIYIGGASYESHKKIYECLDIFENAKIEWIISNTELRNKMTALNNNPKLKFVGFKEDIYSFYGEKSFFIGACGVSFFERAFLNVPQVNFIIADNQLEIADLLARKKLLCLVGDVENNESVELRGKLTELCSDEGRKILEARDLAKSWIHSDGVENICRKIKSLEF